MSITLILSLKVVLIVDIVFSMMLYINTTNYSSIAVIILVATVISGIGSFETSDIQFAMDQPLEALSTQLSAFVHWYFWVMHLGQQTVFDVLLTSLSTVFSISEKRINVQEQYLISTAMDMILVPVWMICLMLAFYLFQQEKKHMYDERVGINPFKRMWQILSFAWKHNYPLFEVLLCILHTIPYSLNSLRWQHLLNQSSILCGGTL